MHYCLFFSCCSTPFLLLASPVLLRSTPFYSVLPLASYVLLRATPRTFLSATPFYHSLTTFFYFVLHCPTPRKPLFTPCYPVLLLRTCFTPRTFIYFWLLAGPFFRSDLLSFSACSAVIQCLFYSHSVSVLHSFSFAFCVNSVLLNLQLSTFDCHSLAQERPQRHPFSLFFQHSALHFILFSACSSACFHLFMLSFFASFRIVAGSISALFLSYAN